MIGAPFTTRRRFAAAMAAGLIGISGALVGAALPTAVVHAATGDCTLPAPLLKTGVVYQVSTAAQLKYIADTPACFDESFLQTAAIDLTDFTTWTPIAQVLDPFTGTYNGDNHAITGLKLEDASASQQGLFGYVSGATLRNVNIDSAIVTTGSQSGILAGVANNATVEHSHVSGEVTATDHVGGLVGYLENSTVEDSTANVVVTGGLWVGGLVGDVYKSLISNSSASGNVSANDRSSGGLIGAFSGGEISNSLASGNVTGTSVVGGLVGDADGTHTANSYSSGSVEGTSSVGGLVGNVKGANISNSYSSGSVSGTALVGGLVGYASTTTFSSSFWDTSVSETSAGVAAYDVYPVGVTGLPTAGMKLFDTFGPGPLGANWAIVNGWANSDPPATVWGICAARDAGYPYLLWTAVGAPSGCPIDAPIPRDLGFVPLAPTRALDTRDGGSMSSAGSVTELNLAGQFTVPDDAVAVALNVTVDQPTTAGYVTVYPCGTDRPTASNVNYAAGQTTSNAVTAYLGTDGKVCIFTMSPTHLVVDINGAYNQTSRVGLVTGLIPTRLFDSRDNGTKVEARTVHQINVTGQGGIPTDATAVVLNVTIDDPSTAGFLTVYPCGTDSPLASHVNFAAGETTSNSVVVSTGEGTVCIYTMSRAHLIVDVIAAFSPTATSYLMPTDINRLVDTRETTTAVEAGSITEITVVGQDNVGATAVVLNVAVDQPSTAGFLTIYPCGINTPPTSNLNFAADQTTSNAVTVAAGTESKVCVYSSAHTHLIVDANASFSIAPSAV